MCPLFFFFWRNCWWNQSRYINSQVVEYTRCEAVVVILSESFAVVLLAQRSNIPTPIFFLWNALSLSCYLNATLRTCHHYYSSSPILSFAFHFHPARGELLRKPPGVEQLLVVRATYMRQFHQRSLLVNSELLGNVLKTGYRNCDFRLKISSYEFHFFIECKEISFAFSCKCYSRVSIVID
jgi:hypothetical protein